VVDAGAVEEEPLDQRQQLVPRGAGLREDVHAGGVEPGGQRPEVQVVHGGHAGQLAQLFPDRRDVDLARRALEQDVRRLPQDPDAARQDEDGDRRGEDRVEAVPAGARHDDGAHDDRERGDRVGRDLEVRGAHAEAVAAARPQHRGGAEVDGEARDGDGEHEAGLHRLRRAEAVPRLPEDPRRGDEQKLRVDERREHLRAGEAERVPARRRAAAQRHSGVGERQRRDVREHVRRVRDEREASRQQAARDLDEQHARGQRERRAHAREPDGALEGAPLEALPRRGGARRRGHAVPAGSTSTRESLKQAPPPRSVSVSGASAFAVVPLSVL
jgi:hypothetical protein